MSFPKHTRPALVMLAVALAASARADLPSWLQHIPSASTVEAALFRTMSLPGLDMLYPRPPKESQVQLQSLIGQAPGQAELYSLRAQADEQALDFAAAEADWKAYAAHAPDGQVALADFYHRRMETAREIDVLNTVAGAPADPKERFVAPPQQPTWRMFERLLTLEADQALPQDATYRAFLARYPARPYLYTRYFHLLLDRKDFTAAQALITDYRRTVPSDPVFPIKASALLEIKRGNADAALKIFDSSFQPLWPADLTKSYFVLLAQTHHQRDFLTDARTRIARNPDDLSAAARLFLYFRQQGHPDTADQVLDSFRASKDARRVAWLPGDLYTLAQLTEAAGNLPEAARYNFALAGSEGTLPNGQPSAQTGLSALIRILLTAPEQPIALGAGNLSMYRDIATLDQGPGYWNGILSLWLNGTSPEAAYKEENQKAQPYFHRAKAAELLGDLDRRFPSAPARPALHAQLIEAYATYGEASAVTSAGKSFLTTFPHAPERIRVASAMADAYARLNDTSAEFALYESLLTELAASTGGMPLSASGVDEPSAPAPSKAAPPREQAAPAFDLTASAPTLQPIPEAVAYRQILDRYLGRLTAAQQIPRALTVLRWQLDRNPDDPLLYERLATFLEQNNLSAQQEETYKLAIARFQSSGWQDKLARLYLRERNREAFAALTRQVTGTFSGTELDTWFGKVTPNQPLGPALALQLNLYAHGRFPHDLTFTRNLLRAYAARPTADAKVREALLRANWWQAPDLRDQFFELLSRTRRLDAELAQLKPLAAAPDDPAAANEQAEAALWTSHFEQSAPMLNSLTMLYPGDTALGDTAASVFRSLAYLDPASIAKAVAIEKNLLAAHPEDEGRLGTLGDLYAEAKADGHDDLPAAAPFWRRIPALHPGSPEGYLQSATVFWDYFEFDDALAEIAKARTRFHDPALFGYQAGAIHEGRRDLPGAIREYAAAALASDAQPARNRLLRLARRPATASTVDRALAELENQHRVARDPALIPLVTLQADVLQAEGRASEIAPLLDDAVAATDTADQAAAIAALAQNKGRSPALTLVYEYALSRQAELASDPVEKLHLQYQIAASYEARNDLQSASKLIEAAYTANPRLLGVVRATTDFYIRTKQPARAVATLVAASQAANSAYAPQFLLEAATDANTAGDYVQARALANQLLAQSPYDARYLAVVADSYARAKDDAALKQFFVEKLAALDAAPLPPAEKKQDTALLRRGLIPAMTRLRDYEGAVGQYIALLSAFPEDAATAQQAALYAIRYSRQPQLLAFLNSTIQQSPKDSRFAILLAQVETTLNDLPAAVTAYGKAIGIRKDRADLYIARASLEERLGQLDAAAADDTSLYILSYRDPQWMVHLAELRARQQRPADAVQALQTAWIAGRPPAAENSFKVAAQLETWNLLAEARTFAEQAMYLAGDDLLTSANASGPATYARILTRLGQPETALATLEHTRAAAIPSGAALVEKQIVQQGVTSITDDQWRAQQAAQRHDRAEAQFVQALAAIGTAIQTYATPEQKLGYAHLLDSRHQADPAPQTWIDAAASAGLLDREADWLRQAVLSPRKPLNDTSASDAAVTSPVRAGTGPSLPVYTALERSRLRFEDLAKILESYAAKANPREASSLRLQAAQAWRDAGDEAAEVRLYRTLPRQMQAQQPRFFDLLLRRSPEGLAALAGSADGALADVAANYAVAHGTAALAQTAVDARAATLTPLWRAATSSLLGLYLTTGRDNPVTTSAFHQALADQATIAERLGHPAVPDRQLTGAVWFPYASRFGAYLAATSSPDAEDFLPAALEAAPNAPAPYLDLARTYAANNNSNAALAEYRHALELASGSPALAATIHDETAVLLWHSGRKDEPVAHWRSALSSLFQVQDMAAAPESFWSTFSLIARHLGQRSLTRQFHPEIEFVLKPYLARNGNYRSNELLHAAFDASATPDEGTAWLLSLASASAQDAIILDDLRGSTWLPVSSREAILERLIDMARREETSLPDGENAGVSRTVQLQLELVRLYLDQNQDAKAQAVFDTIPVRPSNGITTESYGIELAARRHRLQAAIDRWTSNPESVPSSPMLDTALKQLRRATPAYTPDLATIRLLLEYVFEQKRLENTLIATDYFALAQARIDTADLSGALDLLHRAALLPPTEGPRPYGAQVTPEDDAGAYTNLNAVAALLEAAHRPGEAIPFLTSVSQNVPWNASFRLRLARAQQAAGTADASPTFLALAKDPTAPYAIRVEAAKNLKSPIKLGSAELGLLASPTITAQQAEQPYFAAARLVAAARLPNDRIVLLREAIAIDPSNSAARLDLMFAQAAAHQTAAALATYASIQSSSYGSYRQRFFAGTGQSDCTQAATIEGTQDPKLSLPVAEILASLYESDGQTAIALTYLRQADHLEPTVERKQQIVQLQEAIALEQQNASRRPTIRPALDQPIFVQPRLTLAQLQAQEVP